MATPYPSLDQLRERLMINGVTGDPIRFATALLGMAHQNGWTQHPERMVAWMEQLAVDVALASGKGEG